MGRKENEHYFGEKGFFEPSRFFAHKRERRALQYLKEPIELNAEEEITLNHHEYRGPWHLSYKASHGSDVVAKERIQGPTPTRFSLCSPEILEQLEEDEERAHPPYRSKPIVLRETGGIRVGVQLMSFDSNPNVAVLTVRNKGVPLYSHKMKKIFDKENFSQDTLQNKEAEGGAIFALPKSHRTTLVSETGVSISLTGKDAENFILSFSH